MNRTPFELLRIAKCFPQTRKKLIENLESKEKPTIIIDSLYVFYCFEEQKIILHYDIDNPKYIDYEMPFDVFYELLHSIK